jgi:phosphoglycerate dehydrogenase-like enzyme
VKVSKPIVVVTAPFSPEVAGDLADQCDMVYRTPLEHGVSLSSGEHRDSLGEASVLITEIDLVDRASLDLAPHLKLVVTCRAMPVNVDLEACADKSIEVRTTPARNADVTADFAFGLMLSTIRKVSASEAWMRSRQWTPKDLYFPYREFRGMALKGKTLGIIGGGAIGRRMAERAKGFGMDCLIFDPFLTQEQLGELGQLSGLEELMASSDIVTVHAPLMESTIGLISQKQIDLMKPTSFLINAGRAAIVDEEALMSALREKRIQGAGIDVYWNEPPALDDPIFELPNLTITPHVAGASDDVVTEHSRLAIQHVREWLAER